MLVRSIAVVISMALLVSFGSTPVMAATKNNNNNLVGGFNQAYKNVNKELEAMERLKKRQRNAQKKIRDIEYFKYRDLEGEIKFEEKKQKKEQNLIKRLSKLNGNPSESEQLVKSRLNENSFSLENLFLGNLFNSLF